MPDASFANTASQVDSSRVLRWIWGLGSVMGMVVGIVGGSIGDRFGPRRTLAVACVLMGMAGAATGLSACQRDILGP